MIRIAVIRDELVTVLCLAVDPEVIVTGVAFDLAREVELGRVEGMGEDAHGPSKVLIVVWAEEASVITHQHTHGSQGIR